MHPVLLHIGGFELRTYGLMAALAWVSALALAGWRGARRGEDPWLVVEVMIGLIVAGVLGARLLFLMQHPGKIHGLSSLVDLRSGGLVYLGGLAMAGVFTWGYARKKGVNAYWILDLLAPSLALGLALGRVGCFSAGCCYGRPTDLPWGVVFTHPQSIAPRGLALHPTQLYLVAANLLLVVALLWWDRRKRYHGQVFALYLLGYALLRFVVELFRGDPARRYLFELDLWGDSVAELLSTSQALGFVLLAVALGLQGVRSRTPAAAVVDGDPRGLGELRP